MPGLGHGGSQLRPISLPAGFGFDVLSHELEASGCCHLLNRLALGFDAQS